MASARSSVALLCVIALLLVTDVAVAAQPELPQQQADQVTGSTKQFYLRGEVMSKLAENESAVEESLESFERRELASDYGSTSSKPNCSGHCK